MVVPPDNSRQKTNFDVFVDDVGKPILPILAVLLTRATLSGAWIALNEWRITPEPNPFTPLAIRRDWIIRFLELSRNARGTAIGQIASLSLTGGLVIANQANTNRIIADAQPLIGRLTQATGNDLRDLKQQLKNKRSEAIWGTSGLFAIVSTVEVISARNTGNELLNIFNVLSTFGILAGIAGTTIPQIEKGIPNDLTE
jgi:hypothetical protein